MSPEQVEGAEDIDPRSDLYSLGCVLFECLAGHPPFTAEREDVVLRLHLEGRAPDVGKHRGDTPPVLRTVLQKALKTRREARYQSAAEMRAALAEVD